jgi:urease beta subunit
MRTSELSTLPICHGPAALLRRPSFFTGREGSLRPSIRYGASVRDCSPCGGCGRDNPDMDAVHPEGFSTRPGLREAPTGRPMTAGVEAVRREPGDRMPVSFFFKLCRCGGPSENQAAPSALPGRKKKRGGRVSIPGFAAVRLHPGLSQVAPSGRKGSSGGTPIRIPDVAPRIHRSEVLRPYT